MLVDKRHIYTGVFEAVNGKKILRGVYENGEAQGDKIEVLKRFFDEVKREYGYNFYGTAPELWSVEFVKLHGSRVE